MFWKTSVLLQPVAKMERATKLVQRFMSSALK
jgi:hypothetical protein